MEKSELYKLLEGVNPAFFGLGFIQCKINEKQRLHFYHPELLPTVNVVEEVHNHRYDFTSTIVRGSILNSRYVFQPSDEATHYMSDESCNEHVKLENALPLQGTIRLLGEERICAGSSYFMAHDDLHTVQTSFCITLLERSPYKKEVSQVVRPLNAAVVCPFAKKISREECWHFIKQCIEHREEA